MTILLENLAIFSFSRLSFFFCCFVCGVCDPTDKHRERLDPEDGWLNIFAT